MDWFQVVVLAVLQGFTEFLPISSSGHLVIPSQIMGWPDQGLAFDVAVHVGSLAAVLAYFYKDVLALAQAWIGSFIGQGSNDNSRLAWAVIVGTLPAGLIGLLADDWIEANLRAIWVIATTTIVFGIALGIADKLGSRQKELGQMLLWVALLIGFAQALALIPGTSRSGITITAALLLGFTRDASARFSFLLSIPLILAAGGLKTLELIQLGTAVPWAHIIVGTLLSGLTAYACIYGFLKLLDKIGMMPFVIYRLILGVFLFAFILL